MFLDPIKLFFLNGFKNIRTKVQKVRGRDNVILGSRYWDKLIFCQHGAEIWVRASIAWAHG